MEEAEPLPYEPITREELEEGSTARRGFCALAMPKETKKQEWWIPDLLPKERLVLLAAQGGTGKTSFAFYLADLLTRRGLKTEDGDPVRVAYWSFEDEPQDFVNKAGYNENVVFIKWQNEHWFGEREDDLEKLEDFLFTWNAHILFIDPISALLDDDGDNNQAVRKMLNRMLKATSDIGVTIVGIHHFRKGGGAQSVRNSIMGASSWVDTARHTLSLVKNEAGQLFLEVSKSNIAKVGTSWEVFSDVDEYGYHITGFLEVADGTAQKALEEPKKRQENPTIKALKSEFGIGKAFVLDDVRAHGSVSSFYSWIKRNPDRYQELEKDGRKAWIFL